MAFINHKDDLFTANANLMLAKLPKEDNIISREPPLYEMSPCL